jgi:hypothetical protein
MFYEPASVLPPTFSEELRNQAVVSTNGFHQWLPQKNGYRLDDIFEPVLKVGLHEQ